ncbi:MAG: acetyl/propionyl/methylcrotonyl-CoA carboxylase subunit alpha, partial [Anaerolineae bacterium]
MIQTILIANRGEIACRVIRSCKRLGIRAVAVYSDADAESSHVKLADEAVRLGPASASASYLKGDAILRAAQRTGADAIHPGYGFLAENSALARACQAADLLFIGPAAESIAAMGSKRLAKQRMAEAGVPVIPGYEGAEQSNAALAREADRIGFPIMVKAADGGGGKGLRVVNEPRRLAEALAAARHEAAQAFGSEELILEQALLRPRHIEFQILADHHGHVIHLGERECSVQRRHQKIIEETPSLALTPDLRRRMGEVAVAAGGAIGYRSAGTVEFLLDEHGQFYFLEMNTRLQVEHPVTEAVTGLDLVEWQIRIAQGEPLPFRQEEVQLHGHAVEARIYAENPENDFLPVAGRIQLWHPAAADGIRVDSGIATGDEVSIYYDPMLAKIIAFGPDRDTAVRRLTRALETTILLGLSNNLSFLIDVLRHPDYQSGALHSEFVAEHFAEWRPTTGDMSVALIATAMAQWAGHPRSGSATGGYWRNNPNRPQSYRFSAAAGQKAPVEVQLTPPQGNEDTFQISLSLSPKTRYQVKLHAQTGPEMTFTMDGHRQKATLVSTDDVWWVHTRTGVVTLRAISPLPEPKLPADAGGSLRAPMPGVVSEVLVQVGQKVAGGQPLMKLEAMKMETTISTAADGI